MTQEASQNPSGRVAVVTGASSGLGRHFALTLAKAGYDVVAAARRTERLKDLAQEIEALGRRCEAVGIDVTEVASVTEGLENAWRRMGRFDVLVNNAGIALSAKALDHSDDDWNQVIDTNLTGAWHCAQAFARKLAETGAGGCIVNVASILGLRVAGQVAAYAVSKAAVIQMTKALALELAQQNIRVNALAPGYIETDLNRGFLQSDAGERMRRKIPMKRFGRPEDLDAGLLFLAGEGAGYVTGSVLTIDGGHVLPLP
ncbi:glucose 1-dehydrogenase [Pelagibius sp. CAU 1746]|uniref:SDR family NAD(P)-dependent oxidoreductase n=1 Tax=Pelagibius sp. CAU 1746 TaxID=3140370 RepID=UPI00325B274D